MKANRKFLNQPLDFWANVKLISQKVGYTQRNTSRIKVPTIEEIENVFTELKLDSNKIITDKKLTTFGRLLIQYFQHRANFLNKSVEPILMDKNKAKKLFLKLKKELKPTCPLPMNKQKGTKKAPAYFTCIINMLIEANASRWAWRWCPTWR